MFPYHDEKTTQRTSYVTLALIRERASGTALPAPWFVLQFLGGVSGVSGPTASQGG